MEITVSGRHVEVSDRLREVVDDKLSRLERFLDMERADVHFVEQRNPRIAENLLCEVTLEGHGHHVRAKVAAADSFGAIDSASEKLEQQLSRLKTKLIRRGRSRSAKATVAAPLADAVAPATTPSPSDADAEAQPPSFRIVKKKRFAATPMSPDEAAQRMDLLGHAFFFFANSATGRSAVVYRRDDGDVGLIDEYG